MPIVNADVAAVFNEIADLLEVQGANAFRIRAYRNAARTLGDLGRSLKAMVDAGEDLDKLPGIGPDLAGKIAEVVRTGSCAQLDELRGQLPRGVTEMMQLPGLGPRRVEVLSRAGIHSLAELRQAAEEGRVHEIPGFTEAGEQKILDAVKARLHEVRRFKLSAGMQVADALLAELRSVPGGKEAVAAGSLRRGRETVGDLDLLVTATHGAEVMDRFTGAKDVKQVLSRGDTRSSVLLGSGLQVDLRAVPPESFGAAWMYFTGSKAHNIHLRRRAQERELLLNEYGLWRGWRRVAGDTEASVYQALGLRWIPPELREDRGEIEACEAGTLPQLVELADLRGDLHVHTTGSDGRDTLQAMADSARARGLRYIAITDHSKHLALVHGLDAGRLAKQIDAIDAFNEGRRGLRVLKGVEVDILEDGSLDLADDILRRLDLVVGAVHHRFDLPREKQTARLLRAMDSKCFSILAHPTGRLLDERAAYDVDMQRVIRAARQRGCFLELNANPARLDIDDVACRMAKDEGVLVSIATDAHGALDLDNLRFGVGQARRGWLEPRDVLNTRSLPDLLRLLARTMDRPAPAQRRSRANARPKAEVA